MPAKSKPVAAPTESAKAAGEKPRLLAGGNPQIAKADGNAPVQQYICAMPDWKRAVGEHLDALVDRTIPGVVKSVRWNSPFYGMPGQGWFFAFHVFSQYVKVTFFRGKSLTPMPPVESKQPEVRYVHLHEGDPIDDALWASWLVQASQIKGWGRN